MSAPAITRADDPRSSHVHPDDETLAQYASVSRTAVLAVMLGLVSALVLIHPILLVVPLAAIATAVVALRQIATSEGRLLGTWPATAGLCLAALFLGWGLSRQITREGELSRQAQVFANGWLELTRQGKLQRAHQFTLASASRLHSDDSIAEFYAANQDAGDVMKQMFASEPLKTFTGLGPAASFQLQAVAGHSQYGFADDVLLRYSLDQTADGSRKAPLWITVRRTIDPSNGQPDWLISRAEGEPPRE